MIAPMVRACAPTLLVCLLLYIIPVILPASERAVLSGMTPLSAPSGSQAGVTNTLVAFGSIWKYLDNGSDQGIAWRERTFNDLSWASGPAQLGYGDGDETTVVSFGTNTQNRYITTYFRRAFVVTNATLCQALNLRLLRDDGGVVYLNGVEIFRSPNMPAGTISYTNLATQTGENTIDNGTASPAWLQNGTNVIAVEIHQQAVTSSDISFDFELTGVFQNYVPAVFLSSPTNQTVFTAPCNIRLEATASDSDGSISKLEFFANGIKLGETATAPYSLTWSNVNIGGNYQLQAIATDNDNAKGTSIVVNITVLGNYLPAVTLSYPPNNSTFQAPTNILIAASASDPDGIVTNVQFFANGAKLGEAAKSPFTFNWTDATPATYLLTAMAFDNAGASAKSAPVQIIVLNAPPPGLLIATGSVWKYWDTVTNEMPGWTETAYNDSAWRAGPAELGYGDAPGRPEATVVGYGPNVNNRYITTYFRRGFYIPDPSIYKSLSLNILRDDGAIIYLNAQEIFRSNMGSGPVTINTLASNATDDGTVYFPATGLNPNLLARGLNVVAVEIHQSAANSSDISFDLELVGSTTNARPAITLASPADNAVFSAPAAIPLTTSVSDSDGMVTNVQFFAGGLKIGESRAAPFSFNWQNVPLGTYLLTAIATDNNGDSSTSMGVRVYVVASSAPAVASFSPTPGTVSNLTQITVNFSEPVEGVKAADLLVNGLPATGLVGSNAAYTFTFSQPLEGLVAVTWASNHRIVDRENPPQSFNGTTDSSIANYILADNLPPFVVLTTPTPGATVRSLSTVEVTFSEPVGGIEAGDLLLNGVPAQRLSGSQAGPYVFEFQPPVSNGSIRLAWAASHGIHDFAQAANGFGGGEWSYILDARAADHAVVFNEIMYHPASENIREEYLELYNTNSLPVNLTGWRISGGITFLFPKVTIPGGGYLVIAADPAAFGLKYPAVTNLVGGWRGKLSHRGDHLVLRNALDEVVNSVHYASEGDWALRQRGPLDNGSRGWEWFAAHDGLATNTATGLGEGNRSLELLNPLMPNGNGQSWTASLVSGGTPGRANSVFTNDMAPLIYEVTHFPPVPKSSQTVTITARVVDESLAGLQVWLNYRDANSVSPPAFAATNLFDDGLHGDGLAGDGVYGIVLPARPALTVVEYYVSATDGSGKTRTWPAAARQTNGSLAQTANALYQVDNENYTGSMPFYRLVMTESERVELQNINRSSDAEMNAALITIDGAGAKIRQNAGIRIRGAGSRSRTPPNFRVNVPNDRLWNGLSEMNLNTQYTHAQLVGSVFSLRSGMPCAQARVLQVRVNGANLANAGLPQYGCYIFIEPINGEWAAVHYPDDPGGNAYRGSRSPWTANLDYRGTNYLTYMNEGYSKTSNQSANDWTDLFNLTYALSANTPDSAYVAAVRRNANVEMFMRFLAVCNVLDYMETSLYRGVGDDYAMYRGVNDPRFLLIPHDFDTILNEGDTGGDPNRSIWTMLNPPSSDPAQRANFLVRFLHQPEFAPVYYGELKRLIDSTYSAAEFNPMVDQLLTGWVPAGTIANMKNFAANRNAYIRSQIPLTLTVTNTLPTRNGYLYTTNPSALLFGRANAIETRSVTAAGQPASWSAFDARWTNNVALQPGLNRVLVQALNANQVEFDRLTLDIWYDRNAVTGISGPINGDQLWTAAGGPYSLTNDLTVNAGATLTIQPGTTLYLATGVTLTVNGRLRAEGNETQHIRVTRPPGTAGNWSSLRFVNANGTNHLAYLDLEYGGNNGVANVYASDSILHLDHIYWTNTTSQLLDLNNSSISLLNSVLPSVNNQELIHFSGFPTNGHALIQGNLFGTTSGYNDIIDFTGGNRPGPIVQFLDNVFTGGVDDVLDLDGTDAHIEGNIFLHVHQDALRDSASHAISTGRDSNETSELYIARNLFYDCDHALLLKEGASAVLQNNTVVHIATNSTSIALASVVNFGEPNRGVTGGLGALLDGNIFWDVDQDRIYLNYTNALMYWSMSHSLVPGGMPPGVGNLSIDPLLMETNPLAINYTTIRKALSLRPGSPATGTGPNGLDMGALVPAGASISGEPFSPSPLTSVTLIVGGPGITHYRYRLNGGDWSAETSVTNTIVLTGLTNGSYTVFVSGKNSAGFWQDQPAISRSWMVNSSVSGLCLNEVLARNATAAPAGPKYPDLIELYNRGPLAVDLFGMSISDNKDQPGKHVFPRGTILGAGQYLVLHASNDNSPLGLDPSFALKQEGDNLYLFGVNAQLIDTVRFGPQLPDYSIGRLADGHWGLTVPTFGSANVAARLGDFHRLKINEWMAASGEAGDFIELFNPDPLPVALGGLYLTDTPQSQQNLQEISPLSYIAGGGYAVFLADGKSAADPTRAGFKLAAEQGLIGLFATNLERIDQIVYGPQTYPFSQGRSPNGSSNLALLASSTPGAPNQPPPGPPGGRLVLNEVLAKNLQGPNSITNLAGGTPEWIELYNPTPNIINLADLSLSANASRPRQWVFPAGVSIPAGGWRVVLCDPSQPASTNAVSGLNTGFGLTADGGAVILFDTLANGGGQLDQIAYGVQAPGFSVGRTPSGSTNWVLNVPTPGGLNLAAALGNPSQLRINEWMADPAAGGDWFEIYNPNAQPVNLSGLYLTDDLSTPVSRRKFKIAPLSFIGAGLYGYTRFWADNGATSGPDHCPFALKASGETLGLYQEDDTRIDALAIGAQLVGVSEGRLPDGAAKIVRFAESATPAEANYLPLTNIVINEVLSLASTNPPTEQAIELFNVSGTAVDLSGWFLSNLKHDLKKYRIPDGTTIAAGGFKVFYEGQINFDPLDPAGMKLDAVKGDNVYLSETDSSGNLTGYRASVTFGAAQPGVSFGRYTNSVGHVDFTALEHSTFGVDHPARVEDFRAGGGLPNAYPLVGPMVFSEIMYHPTELPGPMDNLRDEYLRLSNASSNALPLFDLAHPQNTWRLRGGVDYDFPTNLWLPAGGSLLVVGFDPTTDTNSLAGFRAAYPKVGAGLPLYGPYRGKLVNDSERLEIYKPGAPALLNAGLVPYILVERVKYSDSTPWDPAADGKGYSLQRLNPATYGNDPANWRAGIPTLAGTPVVADRDGDGLPDAWELLHGLNPDNPLDAAMDPDQDGMTNLEEYLWGTDPQDAASMVKLAIINPGAGDGSLILRLQGITGRTYLIESSDALPGGWTNWTTWRLGASTVTILLTNKFGPGVSQRFFRIPPSPAPAR